MRTPKNPPRVSDIRLFVSRGPWKSKSGGMLTVSSAVPIEIMQGFFVYNDDDLAELPEDIRGFRTYTVRNMPKNGIGGKEFHVIRHEIVLGLQGNCLWTCEDLYGDQKEFLVNETSGIWIPHHIMHTIQSMNKNAGFMIIANTLFNTKDKRTHDSYSRREFKKLQRKIRGC